MATDRGGERVHGGRVEVGVERALDEVLDDPKAAFRLKVRRATRRLLAKRGLGISMDDIAEAAGVNRRTLFRHVEGRDAAIADALMSALDWVDEQGGYEIPSDQSLESWIADFSLRLIHANLDGGRGLWQLASSNDEDLSPELAAVNERRRSDRQAAIPRISQAIWEHGGGTGPCPPVVLDAAAILLTSFTTRSMVDDFGRDAEPLASNIGTILATVVAAQASADGPPER